MLVISLVLLIFASIMNKSTSLGYIVMDEGMEKIERLKDRHDYKSQLIEATIEGTWL